MAEKNTDNIVKKIKGLLAIARDHKNDEESQTAFVMAQKLMMKHNIEMSEVEHENAGQEVIRGQATVYKRIVWWETELADIISKNFRVKYFFNNNRSSGSVKRAIIFLGFESDVRLAKEMYILAYDVITFYTDRYVKMWYDARPSKPKDMTKDLKDSYMQGFLRGLDDKFDEQVKDMEQEWGLMVLVPEEVQNKYDSMFKGKGKGITFKTPTVGEARAYETGYRQGNKVDYTKSTIDG